MEMPLDLPTLSDLNPADPATADSAAMAENADSLLMVRRTEAFNLSVSDYEKCADCVPRENRRKPISPKFTDVSSTAPMHSGCSNRGCPSITA